MHFVLPRHAIMHLLDITPGYYTMLSVYRKFFNKSFIEEHLALEQVFNRANQKVFRLGGVLRGVLMFVTFTAALSILTMLGVLHPQQFLAILILPTFFSFMMGFLTSDVTTLPGYCDQFVIKRLKSYSQAKEALEEKEREFLTLTFYDNQDYTYEFVAFVEKLIEEQTAKALKEDSSGKKAFQQLGELKETLKFFKINYVEHHNDALMRGYFRLYQATQDWARRDYALDTFEAEFKKSNAQEKIIQALAENEKKVRIEKNSLGFNGTYPEKELEIGHTDYKNSL